MVVVYKVALLTYLIAKCLVSIPHIAMVNVVNRKKTVPELVQGEMSGKNIFEEIKKYLDDDPYREDVISELKKVKKLLGTGGAAGKAARAIIDFIDRK